MCGIAGYIGSSDITQDRVNQCLKLMINRGPDNQSYYTSKKISKKNFFLHSRLSIIDINEAANQPIKLENRTLIFNGEIYNYLELKNDLKKKGHKFKTQSDTEVLLRSYIEYGENCVKKFIGMWSFAIIDEIKNVIFLSRDNFGEKPLFFLKNENEFIFGSEIKFIKKLSLRNLEINEQKLGNFLTLGYRSLNFDSETYFKNIFSLEPGTNLILDFNLKITKRKYFKIDFKPNEKIKYNEIIENVRSLLSSSLSLRLRSDVPLAFCLSGGIDSGFLASLAKKKLNKADIKTFSIIDEDQSYDESKNINQIISDLKCENHQIKIKKKGNFFKTLKELIKYHDCPISTISYYVHSFLSEEISRAGFKVALSGNGADEIFSGYYSHYQKYFASIDHDDKFIRELAHWEKLVKPFIRNPILKDYDHFIKNPNDRSFSQSIGKNLENLVKINKKQYDEIIYCKDKLRNSMLNELFHEAVPIALHHDDLNSMFYSVENRSPYLDKDLLEFMLSVPTHYLIGDGYQKKILRDASEGYLVNDVRLARQKFGFNASINSLLSKEEIIEAVSEKNNIISNFIDLKKLNNLFLKKDFKFNGDLNKLLFSIISANIFLDSN